MLKGSRDVSATGTDASAKLKSQTISVVKKTSYFLETAGATNHTKTEICKDYLQ